MPETFPIYTDPAEEGASDKVAAIAEQWGFRVVGTPPEGLSLSYESNQLALKDFSEPKQHGVTVDFLSAQSQYRKQHGGAFKEPLAKAFGVKPNQTLTIVDATPGLGRDAFVLAGVGCQVMLIERSPVVAALLADGLDRLAQTDPLLAARLTLLHGDSQQIMQNWTQGEVNGVYLDPMFPHRKKSALVKKEMRVFQQLLGTDPDADGLLSPALKLANSRVVVKRPNSAPILNDCQPSMTITSKKHRFDVYLTKSN